MRRLIRFLQAPLSLKLLLVEAYARLCMVAGLLRLTPPSKVQRYWVRTPVTRLGRLDDKRISEICRAVVIAARYVPGASCLVQGIVGRSMLQRAGCAAQLHLGVSKNASGFNAHAWLEFRGEALLGGTVTQYISIYSAPR